MNWYVVYTKPKWEKKIAVQLQNNGIECYCPVIVQMRQWSDRKKKVEVPLFNSYVFVRLNENDRNAVFDNVGVVRYLFWLGKPAIVRDDEINIIKKWLNSSHNIDVEVASYHIGDSIALESGPFSTQKATIKEITKTHYVLVLESMGCILKMKFK